MVFLEALSLFLLIAGGFFKALFDRLNHGKCTDLIYKVKKVHPKLSMWFDYPKNTWKNKYKNNDPKNKEKFPGAKTIFVFTTDIWHFSQFMMYNCLIAGVLLLFHVSKEALYFLDQPLEVTHFVKMVILFVLVKFYFHGSFQIFYDTESKVMKFVKSPLIMLLILMITGVIFGVVYNFCNIPYILNAIETSSALLVLLGGFLSIVGFVYGFININK